LHAFDNERHLRALTPQYNMAAGNDTVHVDTVSVTVFYGSTSASP